MKIKILETNELKTLDVAGVNDGDHIGMVITQSDFDWWKSHICDSDFNYAKVWPVQLLQAIIEKQRAQDTNPNTDRVAAIKRYFGDIEEGYSYHKIKNLKILDEQENDAQYDYELEHNTIQFKFAFTLTNVLVPQEHKGGVCFENMDLDVEINGGMTRFFVDYNEDSVVIKTPYFKDCSGFLNNAGEDWAMGYFKHLLSFCSFTKNKSLGELLLDAIKEKFQTK